MVNKEYSASSIANYFLDRGEKENKAMTLMKLVKLVYIAHGWSLSAINTSLLAPDESVQAWKYGPVIPSLYHELKIFGSHQIPKGFRTKVFYPDDGIPPFSPSIDKDDKDLRDVLDIVWKLYSDHSASSLVNLTHKKDTPWYDSYKDGEKNIQIDDDKIREHFNDIIDRLSAKNG